MIKYAVLAFLLISCLNAKGQKIFVKYESKRELNKDTKSILNEFNNYVKCNGFTLPYLPKIEVKSTPKLIYLNKYDKLIVLPIWDELDQLQREYFINLLGTQDDAIELFTSLFNWFFIAHEFAHLLQSEYIPGLNDFNDEKLANQIAANFYMSKDIYRDKINYLKQQLKIVLSKLPEMDFGNLSYEEYFNVVKSDVSGNYDGYAYYQFRFILESIDNNENFDLQKVLN